MKYNCNKINASFDANKYNPEVKEKYSKENHTIEINNEETE